jgi:PTH1 family peptidyl-tRNA hydrolase
MNLSGQAVLAAGRFYKLELSDLLVISDDIDLEVGQLRMRSRGSSGGQKGLTDIERRIGSREFARLRLGIGRPAFDAAAHVLAKFDPPDREIMNKVVGKAAEAAECWVREGCESAMNRYNGWVIEDPQRNEKQQTGDDDQA